MSAAPLPVGRPEELRRPGRVITGMSAVLLPHLDPHTPDRDGFLAHLRRTAEAGLVPAVNMDTGFGPSLGSAVRRELLATARAEVEGELVAGVHVDDAPGDPFDADALHRAVEEVAAAGALPILFPSHGLAVLDDEEIVAALAAVGERVDRFLGFELSEAFHPAGRLLSLEAYAELLRIPACVGAKHSSLERGPEWDRLALRDRERPGFLVLTGNDLAIDMVTYGSDYLLGISTFAPDLFAERDRRWAAGDPSFHRLNDDLQYLGRVAFRRPVPAYKHDAAMFLWLRGWIDTPEVPAGEPIRPASDLGPLAELADRLGVLDPDRAAAAGVGGPGWGGG